MSYDPIEGEGVDDESVFLACERFNNWATILD